MNSQTLRSRPTLCVFLFPLGGYFFLHFKARTSCRWSCLTLTVTHTIRAPLPPCPLSFFFLLPFLFLSFFSHFFQKCPHRSLPQAAFALITTSVSVIKKKNPTKQSPALARKSTVGPNLYGGSSEKHEMSRPEHSA